MFEMDQNLQRRSKVFGSHYRCCVHKQLSPRHCRIGLDEREAQENWCGEMVPLKNWQSISQQDCGMHPAHLSLQPGSDFPLQCCQYTLHEKVHFLRRLN